MSDNQSELINEDIHQNQNVHLDQDGDDNNSLIDSEDLDDISIEVTENMENVADDHRNAAVKQFDEGKYNDAILLYKKAIKSNPYNGMFYQERAHCYLKLKQPIAAINDSNRSLRLNPNSSFSYDWRGLSYKLLKKWEQAFMDFISSLELNYDENIYKEMIEIEPKAKQMREHRRKYEDKLLNARLEEIIKMKEEYEISKNLPNNREADVSHCSRDQSQPAGFGIFQLKVDQALVEDLKDTKVQLAIKEIESGHATVQDYRNDPSIFNVLIRLKSFMEQV